MSDTAILSEELRGFGLEISDEATLEKLLNLGLKWGINETLLVEKYVAFQRNTDLSDKITQKDVDYFDREISSRLETSKVKTTRTTLAPVSTNILPQSMLQDLIATQTKDEQNDLFSSYIPNAAVRSSLDTTFRKRLSTIQAENREPSISTESDVICTYSAAGAKHSLTASRALSSKWIIEAVNEDASSLRYMHQPTHEKAEVLESWTWRVVKQILDAIPTESLNTSQISKLDGVTSLSESSLSQLTSDTQHSAPENNVTQLHPSSVRFQSCSLVAGRIGALPSSTGIVVPDGPKDDPSSGILFTKQRLSLSNAGLIGLRRVNGNSDGIVKLDLTHSDRPYSVHAGQPVVLRATNPTGQSLEVVELLQTPLRKPPEINLPSDADLKIMVACGPYTLSDSNEPSLLLSLLKQVKQARPNVLVLIGPMVDSKHAAVQSYTESTYEELCQNRLNSVAEYCSHLDIQLVVVPSCREAHHDPVYPTPPLDKTWTQCSPELAAWYRNVHFVWDPCLLRIGDYVFGVTSVDVLSHLSSEEISSGCTGDRIARLCKHLASCESFYPVHPPSDDLPLDYLLWDQRSHLSVIPHCLIIPSRLRQFAKNVDDILFVNPGYVSRDQSAGSYACLTVCGRATSESAKDDSTNAVDHSPLSEHPSHSSICEHAVVTVHRL